MLSKLIRVQRSRADLLRQVVTIVFLFTLLLAADVVVAQVNVYTRSNDGNRSGDNLNETTLTPANVNPQGFGKLFTVNTDGEIYAQPLYVSQLDIAGGVHDVVFVATMHNSVYALDAKTGTKLWMTNFGTAVPAAQVDPNQNVSSTSGFGILSTPVIDPSTNIMYLVHGYQYQSNGSPVNAWLLEAVNIVNGERILGSPVNIAAQYKTADLTSPIVFNATMQSQRPGLALANGNVYIAFASHEDATPYYGWVLAYSASTLAQVAVYSTTTVGFAKGGIWMAGQAPVVDAQGNLYYSTGNGEIGETANHLYQSSQSFIKLSPTLQLLDYFTPSSGVYTNGTDQDLGSSGMLLVPNTNWVLGGGKPGILYLANTNDLGQYDTSEDQVVQEFQAIYGNGTSHIHGSPVYFNSGVNGPSVYLWGENDVLRAFQFNASGGLLNTTPFAKSSMTAPATHAESAMPGGFLSVSANGTQNGIVWASTPYSANALAAVVQGVLYAFDANNLQLLWSDKDNDSRDEVGLFAKYCPPVIANGRLYMATFGPLGTTNGSGALVAYGLVPYIASIDANFGAPTAIRMVTGSSFGASQGSSTVTVNGVPAAIVYDWSATSFKFVVPAQASTGNVVVHVGGAASNGIAFTVYPDPVISGFSPSSGSVGTTVTITGTALMAQHYGFVQFNGVTAPIVSQSGSSLQVTVPAGATTGPVVVHANGVSATSSANFIVN